MLDADASANMPSWQCSERFCVLDQLPCFLLALLWRMVSSKPETRFGEAGEEGVAAHAIRVQGGSRHEPHLEVWLAATCKVKQQIRRQRNAATRHRQAWDRPAKFREDATPSTVGCGADCSLCANQ